MRWSRFRDDNRLTPRRAALRPAPRIAFAAELDERVAAGFPRRRARRRRWRSSAARLRAMKPRQLLLPAAAAALVAIVVATVVVGELRQSSIEPRRRRGQREQPGAAIPSDGLSRTQRVPRRAPRRRSEGDRRRQRGVRRRAPAPPRRKSSTPSTPNGCSGPKRKGAAGSDNYTQARGLSLKPVSHRDIERSTAIVLGTDPDDVADAAAQVFAAVHAAHGVVLQLLQHATAAPATRGAQFDLLIPSGQARRRAGRLLRYRRGALAPRRRPSTSPRRPSAPAKSCRTPRPRSTAC